MKIRILQLIGKALMKLQWLHITIIDDAPAYFSKQMLSIASSAGYPNIKRLYWINEEVFKDLHKNPPDIIIIDVKGVVDKRIAKDGLEVAALLYRNTPAFVVITSAHQYHLRKEMKENDYILEDRNLTAVDFINAISVITQSFLRKKLKPYKKLIFKLGFSLAKKILLPNGTL